MVIFFHELILKIGHITPIRLYRNGTRYLIRSSLNKNADPDQTASLEAVQSGSTFLPFGQHCFPHCLIAKFTCSDLKIIIVIVKVAQILTLIIVNTAVAFHVSH